LSRADGTAKVSQGSDAERHALTAMHRLFRYPAKFHGPLARALLETYTEPGSRVLDPFCGSGTLILESLLINRHVNGTDVDPLAAFVARAKARPYDLQDLRATYKAIEELLSAERRSKDDYDKLQFQDISSTAYDRELDGLEPPAIPNIFHWFRRYVIVDLARIYRILTTEINEPELSFFKLCFAAIIRLSSNADPVPVSGLEVTSHMLKRHAKGRVIDPYLLYQQAVRRSLKAIEHYQALRTYDANLAEASHVVRMDSTRDLAIVGPYDAVITSPPYHGAVDYYRRHTLEMFWLDLVRSVDDRLSLLPSYIGRVRVAHRDCSNDAIASAYGLELYGRMVAVSSIRAAAMRHYCQGMHRFFLQLDTVLPAADAKAVLVVGDSNWKGERIETARLLSELAQPTFRLSHKLQHHIKNRYMSYSRHNSASIDTEQVLIFERVQGNDR
jgi:hypothetical protein